MADYPPPSQILPEFNPAVFRTNDTPLTIAEAENYFLSFPTAQGTENFGTANIVTANVSGTLTAGTFSPTNLVVSGDLSTTNSSTFATVYGYQTTQPSGVSPSIHNTAYGYQAAKTLSATTGTGGNTAFGAIAMPAVTGAGANNTAVGHNSLSSLTSGLRNTAVGAATVTTTVTTGADNTTIGFNAKVGSAAQSFATVIGSGAVSSTDNSITLGRVDTDSVRLNYITPMYSALPTLTSADIGYRYSESISFVTPSNGATIYTSTVTLPIGVWLIYLNMSFTGVFGLGYLSIFRVTTNVNFGVIPLVQTTNGGGLNAILAGSIVMPILTASKVEISYNGIITSTLTDNGTNDIVYVRLA